MEKSNEMPDMPDISIRQRSTLPLFTINDLQLKELSPTAKQLKERLPQGTKIPSPHVILSKLTTLWVERGYELMIRSAAVSPDGGLDPGAEGIKLFYGVMTFDSGVGWNLVEPLTTVLKVMPNGDLVWNDVQPLDVYVERVLKGEPLLQVPPMPVLQAEVKEAIAQPHDGAMVLQNAKELGQGTLTSQDVVGKNVKELMAQLGNPQTTVQCNQANALSQVDKGVNVNAPITTPADGNGICAITNSANPNVSLLKPTLQAPLLNQTSQSHGGYQGQAASGAVSATIDAEFMRSLIDTLEKSDKPNPTAIPASAPVGHVGQPSSQAQVAYSTARSISTVPGGSQCYTEASSRVLARPKSKKLYSRFECHLCLTRVDFADEEKRKCAGSANFPRCTRSVCNACFNKYYGQWADMSLWNCPHCLEMCHLVPKARCRLGKKAK